MALSQTRSSSIVPPWQRKESILAVLLLGFKFGLFASFEPFVLMGGFVLIACALGIPTFYFFERPAKRALLNWGRTFLGAPVAAGSATGS